MPLDTNWDGIKSYKWGINIFERIKPYGDVNTTTVASQVKQTLANLKKRPVQPNPLLSKPEINRQNNFIPMPLNKAICLNTLTKG